MLGAGGRQRRRLEPPSPPGRSHGSKTCSEECGTARDRRRHAEAHAARRAAAGKTSTPAAARDRPEQPAAVSTPERATVGARPARASSRLAADHRQLVDLLAAAKEAGMTVRAKLFTVTLEFRRA